MKVRKLNKFDAAEHLRTPKARAEYLSIVLADGDLPRSVTPSTLLPELRE
jgi:DNA-binding phage protein